MQAPNTTVKNRWTLRKIFSMLLAVAMVVSLLPLPVYAAFRSIDSTVRGEMAVIEDSENNLVSVFAGGEGTAESPYQVATTEQLDQIRNYLDKNYILTADIDLAEYDNWEPIGIFQPLSDKAEDAEKPKPEVAFTGNFDGDGHTIANVTINQPTGMATGLFGCVVGEQEKPNSIYDLTVKDVDVTGSFLVGGVVGLQFLCTLEDVSLIGSNVVRGYQGAGGITGVSFGDLSACDAVADIVLLGDGGGCAGVLAGGQEGVSVIDCTATGTVSAEGDECFGLGGLMGAANDGVAVTNCHADVSITALGKESIAVGGLLGYTGTQSEDRPTSVTGCSADATIIVSDSTTQVGGLVGGNFYPEFYAYVITGCDTSGSIVGGSDAVGSIAGYAHNSEVKNCTSTMTINGESENVPQVGKIANMTPVLTADSIGNIVGSSVDLTFTDDAAWRTAISGITVDGTALTTGQYTSTAGKISIVASVLTTAGAYSIAIKATGYIDAVVTQMMATASGGGSGGLSSTIGILVVAHGSAEDSWNQPVQDAIADIDCPFPVEIGFLEFVPGEEIATAVANLEEQGVKHIITVPIFVASASSHIEEIKYMLGISSSITKEEATEEGLEVIAHNAEIEMTPALDCHQLVAEILDERIATVSQQADQERVYVVTGLNFPDALVAGNLAAYTLSPLIMVDQGLPEATETFLTANKATILELTIVGGEGVISLSQDRDLRNALK